MAEGIPARLTRREGRRFGVQVGGAFIALAALFWWRGRPAAAGASGAIGMALLLAGLIAPAHLGAVHRAWMKFAETLSRITTPVLMAVVYFVIVAPLGLLMRAFGRNPLRRRSSASTYWVERREGERRGDLERQF